MTRKPPNGAAETPPTDERLSALQDHFLNLSTFLAAQIAALDTTDPAAAGAQISALSELQAYYRILMRTEADFRAELASRETDDALDLGKLRDQIGSALDRIRRAQSTKAVPRRP